MLRTEDESFVMGERVRVAAVKALGESRPDALRPVYEHGQWWVEDRVSGAQWAANDAEGPPSVDGFDFEMVTEPREGGS